MKGEKINVVSNAVQDVVEKLQEDIPVSIFTFGATVNQILPATSNRLQINSALQSITVKGKTPLYDAIDLATKSSISNFSPRVVVLSDGKDSSSKINLNTLLSQLTQRNITVDIIGLEVLVEDQAAVRAIAESTGGGYYQLDDLGRIFELYGKILDDEIFEVPQQSEPLQIKVETNPAVQLTFSVISGILAFFLLLAIRLSIRRRRLVEARQSVLALYTFSGAKRSVSRLREALTSYAFIPDKVEKHIRERLELIHSIYSYENVIRFLLGIWIASNFTLFLTFHNFLIGFVLSFAVPPIVFEMTTNFLLRKQKKMFEDELPEMLNVVASGLTAGLGLQQSLEAYASASDGEVSRQIRRAIGEIRVGTPSDEALMAVAKRMESEDLKWAVTAHSIQRIVGGSMATILKTAYETVRSRAEIRREVRTLAAEGKLSGRVLMALPIGIFLFLSVTRRDYVGLFWSNPIGIFFLVLMATNMIVGSLWLRKIVDIKL
jgi:Flp pilus assembly protein TadB/uncharacterized protein YegL